MAIGNLELIFASPERPGIPGQTRREITYKFDNELVSSSDMEVLARKSVGKDIQTPGDVTFVVCGYRLFGDNVTLIVARDNDQVIAERKAMERKRIADLELEIMEGLQYLLDTGNSQILGKKLQAATVEQKALTHFQTL